MHSRTHECTHAHMCGSGTLGQQMLVVQYIRGNNSTIVMCYCVCVWACKYVFVRIQVLLLMVLGRQSQQPCTSILGNSLTGVVISKELLLVCRRTCSRSQVSEVFLNG